MITPRALQIQKKKKAKLNSIYQRVMLHNWTRDTVGSCALLYHVVVVPHSGHTQASDTCTCEKEEDS